MVSLRKAVLIAFFCFCSSPAFAKKPLTLRRAIPGLLTLTVLATQPRPSEAQLSLVCAGVCAVITAWGCGPVAFSIITATAGGICAPLTGPLAMGCAGTVAATFQALCHMTIPSSAAACGLACAETGLM